MGKRLSGRSGLTLVELVVAGVLFSVVFLAAASAHVTAAKFFESAKQNQGQVLGYAAMEHMTRKIGLANSAVVGNSGAELKIRWDYNQTTFAPLGTPKNYADDSWIKYRFVEGEGGAYKLEWAADDAQADDEGTVYAELEPKLVLYEGSLFSLENPTASGSPTAVRLTLVSERGIPAVPFTLSTDVSLGASAKN